MWQLFHLLDSYEKSKHKIRITNWAKSIINWLTAKICFALFFDDTAKEDEGVVRRQAWDRTETYFLKLSI